MGLVDCISRNLYRPAKFISKFEEFLVATLSRIYTDAKLLQQKNFAMTLNKYYYDNKYEKPKSSI